MTLRSYELKNSIKLYLTQWLIYTFDDRRFALCLMKYIWHVSVLLSSKATRWLQNKFPNFWHFTQDFLVFNCLLLVIYIEQILLQWYFHLANNSTYLLLHLHALLSPCFSWSSSGLRKPTFTIKARVQFPYMTPYNIFLRTVVLFTL